MNTKFYISRSKIHGYGAFTKHKIKKGEKIYAAIKNIDEILPTITKEFGSMINHSYKPTCVLYKSKKNNVYYVVARQDLPKDIEITLNYNDTPWFIMNAMPWYT